ncbi:calmodulin binding protein-like [Striga asiatica]|uniref:Calmodulin binding protein-like n=1 Tax=Striga asiatica TaxID=4170 RepID=A0A5A7PN84_STRAF|nr:calmodulin binding protein-like [Striga asiatica]
MAAKRLLDGDEALPNRKQTKTKSSFASVIREVVMVNFLEDFSSTLEPMLRRVVSEEVEKALMSCRHKMLRSAPPLIATSSAPGPQLHLRFSQKLSLPIFTGTKILDAHGGPLQILLIDSQSGPNNTNIPITHDFPIKIELVVLDGDFPNNLSNNNSDDDDNNTVMTWTEEEFEKSVVRERSGRRPLLAARGGSGVDLRSFPMRDGVACLGGGGDIELTDNSSWIRSRRFRLGARVVVARDADGGVVRVREAITEPFVVKDHRGELYKKHHPPTLDDEVWRLEKIGKGGVFHRKLASHGIDTIQDFLKLFTVDSSKLRKILGNGMSEKKWQSTLKHAKTCVMGTKLYRSHGDNCTLTFNPICQLIKAEFNGRVYYENELKDMQTVSTLCLFIPFDPFPLSYIKSLVNDAYAKWSSLEELDGLVHETALLTQGKVLAGHQQLVGVNGGFSSGLVHNYMVIDDVVDRVYTDDWPLSFYSTTDRMTCASYKSTGDIRFSSESSSGSDIL